MAIDEFDLSGDTSGTYSVNNDQVTDSFSLAQPSAYGTDAGLSPGAISSIGSGVILVKISLILQHRVEATLLVVITIVLLLQLSTKFLEV